MQLGDYLTMILPCATGNGRGRVSVTFECVQVRIWQVMCFSHKARWPNGCLQKARHSTPGTDKVRLCAWVDYEKALSNKCSKGNKQCLIEPRQLASVFSFLGSNAHRVRQNSTTVAHICWRWCQLQDEALTLHFGNPMSVVRQEVRQIIKRKRVSHDLPQLVPNRSNRVSKPRKYQGLSALQDIETKCVAWEVKAVSPWPREPVIGVSLFLAISLYCLWGGSLASWLLQMCFCRSSKPASCFLVWKVYGTWHVKKASRRRALP